MFSLSLRSLAPQSESARTRHTLRILPRRTRILKMKDCHMRWGAYRRFRGLRVWMSLILVFGSAAGDPVMGALMGGLFSQKQRNRTLSLPSSGPSRHTASTSIPLPLSTSL
ncbi:uncharacterized protein BDV17DRAFT_257726 [Aspergillus undulatus]|uniref:uncharacterized protein n=1 Tax=Aspergillus undulatus TaxID=1810928 RepID=UPI003CCCD295